MPGLETAKSLGGAEAKCVIVVETRGIKPDTFSNTKKKITELDRGGKISDDDW